MNKTDETSFKRIHKYKLLQKQYRKWFGDTMLEFFKYQKTGQGP